MRQVYDELWWWWFQHYIQSCSRVCAVWGISLFALITNSLVSKLSHCDFIHAIPVVRMIRISWVEKREFGVGALTFPNFVLKLRRINGTRDKEGCPVDYG